MAKAIRRNNTGKKAASFILGFFSCILLVIGSFAGLGIWAWYGVTLNKLENSFGFNTPLVQDNGAIKDQTLGQIIQTIMGYTDLSGKTLKDVKDDFSLDIPSTIEGKDNYSKDLDSLLEQLRLEDLVGIGDVISNAMEQPEFLAALVTGRDNPLAIIFEYFTIDDIEGLIGQELPQYGLLKNGDMNLAEVLIAVSGATNMDKLSLEYIEDTLLDGDYIRYVTGVLSLLSDIRGMSVNEIIAGLEDGTLLDQIKVGTILDGANELLSEIINDKQFEEGDEAFINQSFIENYRELSIQDVIDDPLALADVNLGDLFRLAEKALGPEKTEAVAQRFDSLNLKELIDDPINTLEESNLTLGDLLDVVNIFAGEVDAEGNITGGVIPDSIVTIFDDFNIGAVLNGKFEEEMQHLVINDFMRAINDMAGSDVITDAVLDLFTQNGTEMTVYDLIKEGGFESFYRAVTVEQLLNIVNSYSNDMIDKSMFEGILHVTVGQIIDDPMNSLDFEAGPFLQGLDSLIAGTDSYEGTYIKAEVLELFKKEDGTSYTVGEIVDDIEGFGFGIRISDVLDVVEAYAGDIFVEPVENLVKDWTVGDMTEVDTYLDIYVRDLLEIAEYYLPGGLITEELYKALGDYQIRAFTDIDEFGQISLGDLFAVVNSYLDDPLIDLSRLTSSIRTYTEQLTIADIADDPYRAVLPVLGIASTFIFTDTIPYQVNSFFDSYTYAQYHVDPLGALLETKIKDAAVFLLEIAANFVDNPPLFETAQDAISELFGDATIYQAATDVLDTLNVGNILGTINVILDQEVITQEVKDAFDFTIREIIDDTDGVLDSITIEKLVYVLNSYTEYLAPELEHELIPLSGLESGVREDIATTSIKEIMDSPLNAVIPVLGAVSAYIFEGNIPTSVNDMFASIDYENYHADPAAELMNLQPAHVVQFINEVVYRYTGTAISDEALAVLAVIFDGVTMEDFTSVDRLLSALRVYNMMQAVNMVAGVDVFNDGWLRTFYTVTLYDLVFNGEDVLLALNLGNFIEIFNEYELGDIVLSGLPDEARTYVEQLSVNDIIGDPARLIAPVYLMAAGYIFKEDMPDSVTGVCGDIVFSGYHNDPVGGVYMVKMADLVNSVFDALRKYDIADIGDATDLFYNEDQDDPWVRVIDMFTVDTYKNMKIKEFFSFNGIPEKYLEAVELLVGDSTVGDCISGEVLKVITVGNILRSVNIIAEKQLISDSLCEIFDEFTIQGVIDDPMNALEIKVGPLLEAINETINPDKATIAPGIISLFGDYTIKDIIDDPMGFLRSLKVQDAVDAFNFYAPEKLDLKLEMYTMMSTLTVGKIMDYPAYIAPLVLAIAGNYLYEQDPPQSYVDLINEFDAEGSLADEALDIRVWNLIDVINETYQQFAGNGSRSDTFPIKQSVRNLFTAEDTLRVFTQKDFYFNTDLSQLVTIFYDYVTSLEFNQELYDLLDGVTVQSIMDGAYKDFLVTDIIKAITNFIPAEIPYLQPILSFVENWTIGSIMDGSCLKEVQVKAVLDLINEISPDLIKAEVYEVFGEATIWGLIQTDDLDLIYIDKILEAVNAYTNGVIPTDFVEMFPYSIQDVIDDPMVLTDVRISAILDAINNIINKDKQTITQETIDVFGESTIRDIIDQKLDYVYDLKVADLLAAIASYIPSVNFDKSELDEFGMGDLTIRDLKDDPIQLAILGAGAVMYVVFGKIPDSVTDIYNKIKDEDDMLEAALDLPVTDLFAVVNECYQIKSGKTDDIIKQEVSEVFVKPDGTSLTFRDMTKADSYLDLQINNLIEAVEAYVSQVGEYVKPEVKALLEGWLIRDLYSLDKWKSIELSELFDIVNSYKADLIKTEVYNAFGSKTIGDMIKVETYKQLPINDLLPIINAYANKEIVTDEIKAVFEDWVVSDLWNVEKLKSIELSKLFDIVNSYKSDLIKAEVYNAFGSKTIGDMIKVETYKQLPINDLLPIINAYANKEIITDEIKAVFEDWMVSDLWNVEKLKSIELSKLFDIVNSYKADLIKNSIYEAIGGNTIGQMLELETYKAITLNSLMNIVYDYTKLEENQLITDFLSDVTIGDLANADTYDRFLLSDALRIVNSYKDVIPEEIIDIVSGVTFKDFAYPKTLLSKIQVVPVLAFANDKLNLGFDRDKMDTALGTLTFYDFIFKIHTTCKTINLTAALDLLVDRWAPVELIQTFTEDSVYDLYTTPKDVLGKVVVADVFKFSFIPTNIQEGMEIALCGIKVSDCIEYKTLADKLYLGKIAEGLDKAIGGKYVIATDELIALCRDYTVYDLYKNYKQIAQETMLTEVVGVINSYFKDVEMDISNVDYIKDLTVYDLIEKPQYLIVLGAYGGLYFWYDGEIPEVYFELANEFADGGVWAITVNSTLAVGEELFHKISGKDTDIIRDEVYALFEGWTYESFKSTDALKNLEIPALFDAVNAYKENLIHSEVSDVFTLADGSAMTIGDLLTAETRNQIVINNALKAVESYLKSDYIKDSVYALLDGVTLGNVTDKDTYLDMMVWKIYKVAEEYIVGDKTDGVYGRIMSEEFQSALSDLIGTWTVRDLKYKNTYREIKLNTLFDLVNIAADKDLIKDEVCTVFEGWTLEMLKDVESWKALEISAILDAVNAYKENLIHSEVGGIFVLADGSAMTIGDLLTAEGRNQIVVNNVFTAVESYLEKDYIKDSVYNLFEGVTLETLVKADTYLDMMVWDIYKVAEEYIVGDKTDGVYGRIMSEQFQSTLNDIIGTWRVRDLKYKNTYWEISVGSMFDLVNFALDKFIFKQSVIDLFEDWTLKDLTDTSKLKELKVNNLYLVAADYKSNLPSAISNYLFNEQTQDAFVKLFEDKRLVDLKDKEVYKSMLVNDVFDLINGVLSPKFDAFLGEAFYELGRTTEEDGTVRELTVAELFTKDGLLDLELGTLADAGLQMIANFGKNYALNEDIRSMLDGMTVRELISNKMNFVVIGGTVALLIYFEGDIPDSVMNFINKLDVGASDFKTLLADITVEDTIEMIKGFGYYPAFLPLDVYDVIKPCRIVGIVEDPIGELGMLTLSDLAKFSFIPELFQDILSGENIGKVTLAEIKESKAAAFKDVTVGEITDHITALPEVVRDIVRNMNLGNCFLENGLVNEIKAVKLADFVKPGQLFDKLGTELIDFLADPERALTIGDLIDNPAKALGDISLKTLFSMLGTFDESFMNAIADITLTDFLDKKLEVFYDIKIGNLFDLGDDAVAKVVADMTINDIRGGELSNKRIGEFLDVIETIDPVTGEITYRAGTSDTIKAIGHLTLTEIQNGALDDVRIAVFLGVGTVNADGTIDYAEGTSPFITAIGHLTLGSITEGDNLKDAINSIALKDIFTGDDLPRILTSLFYDKNGNAVTLTTLSERIKNLTVKDVFGEQSERTGVLKALGDDVMIDNLMVELTKAMFGEKSGQITVTTFSGKEGAISISAAAVDREYLISDLDEATLTAIGAALGTTVDATTYYKVKVSAKTDSSVTLVATTKGSVKMVDVMEGSGETYHGDENLYVQELIYKMNQKPTIDGVEIQKPGATDPDDTYESWWDLIMEQAA